MWKCLRFCSTWGDSYFVWNNELGGVFIVVFFVRVFYMFVNIFSFEEGVCWEFGLGMEDRCIFDVFKWCVRGFYIFSR